MKLSERISALKHSWPHPLWAGLKRKTVRTKLVGIGSSTTVALAAYAATDVLPADDMKVVAILVGVLAALGALIIVITKTMGEALATLGRYIPRRNEREDVGHPAERAQSGAATHDDVSVMTVRFVTRLEALETDVKDLRATVCAIRVEAEREFAQHREQILAKLDEHHTFAMQFLSDRSVTLGAQITSQVNAGLGAARDDLRRSLVASVEAAVAAALAKE